MSPTASTPSNTPPGLIVYIRQIADRLAQLEKRDYGFTVPYTTLSTGVIRGGIAANVIPKDCEFQFDMRTLPSASPDALYQEIRAQAETLAREMRAVDPQSGIELVWASQTLGSRRHGDRCDRALGHATCPEIQTVGKVSYGTEAGLFQQMGVPTRHLRTRRHRRGASTERIRGAGAAGEVRGVHEPDPRDGVRARMNAVLDAASIPSSRAPVRTTVPIRARSRFTSGMELR